MIGRISSRQSVFKQLLAMGLVLMMVLLAAFTITNLQMRLIQKENTLNLNSQNMTVYSPTMYTYFFQDSVERAIFTDDVNTVFSNTILLQNNISGIYVFD